MSLKVTVLITVLCASGLPALAQTQISADDHHKQMIPMLPTMSMSHSDLTLTGSVYFDQFSTCTQLGPPVLNGYAVLDHDVYLDRPDPITSRASAALEEHFILRSVKGDITGALSKTFCQIGVTRMVIDFRYAVEDDAIAFVDTRVVYVWANDEDRAGWQIAQLGERLICARQRSSPANVCQ